MNKVRLQVSNLNKSFAAPVLKDLNLSIGQGEIHAIVGENGAGKTTLVNILAGLLDRDSGHIELDGEPYEPSRAADAFSAGVSVAVQELSTIGTLTVAENIALRHLPSRNSLIEQQSLHQLASDMLQLVGLQHVAPDLAAESLSIAERQLLELARALAMDCRLLILDEPTAALTAPQAERVHAVVRQQAAAGRSVIYISHRLDDVLKNSHVVSVLRDGEVKLCAPSESLTAADLVLHMSGSTRQRSEITSRAPHEATVALQADNIRTTALPHAISLACHRGELLGIAGLEGSGRNEILQALFGLDPLTAGEIRRHSEDGTQPIRSAAQAVRCGMGYLGEERQAMGLFAGQSILNNMMIPGRPQDQSALSLINRTSEQHAVVALVDKLAIRCEDPHQDISELSGGNQQKVLIARWLHCEADILLLNEPTRGVDVATKHAIYELLFELQAGGKSIVIASSESEELMLLCDRIMVFSDKKLVRVFERGQWSEEEILTASFQEHTGGSPMSRTPNHPGDEKSKQVPQ
jgi:ribose transport system ATP-binding protein